MRLKREAEEEAGGASSSKRARQEDHGAPAATSYSGPSKAPLVGQLDCSDMEKDAVEAGIRDRLWTVLERRGGSLSMSDLVNEDSELRNLARRFAELNKSSQRSGFILRAVKETCGDFAQVGLGGKEKDDRTQQVIYLAGDFWAGRSAG